MNLENYKKAHQPAQELLAGPDHIVIIANPVFDMPGAFTALPVKVAVDKVEGVDVVVISPTSAT
jgi:hypothetical protein